MSDWRASGGGFLELGDDRRADSARGDVTVTVEGDDIVRTEHGGFIRVAIVGAARGRSDADPARRADSTAAKPRPSGRDRYLRSLDLVEDPEPRAARADTESSKPRRSARDRYMASQGLEP